MPAEILTDRQVRLAKVEVGHRLLSDGRGLYLRVTATGGKSWVYRYKVGRKQTDLGLGPYPDKSLAAAREKALAMRRLRLDGQDPLASKRSGGLQRALSAARSVAFQDCAERYREAHRAGWRSAHHAGQRAGTLDEGAYPVIG